MYFRYKQTQVSAHHQNHSGSYSRQALLLIFFCYFHEENANWPNFLIDKRFITAKYLPFQAFQKCQIYISEKHFSDAASIAHKRKLPFKSMLLSLSSQIRGSACLQRLCVFLNQTTELRALWYGMSACHRVLIHNTQ